MIDIPPRVFCKMFFWDFLSLISIADPDADALSFGF
jgi:hypothetical protein